MTEPIQLPVRQSPNHYGGPHFSKISHPTTFARIITSPLPVTSPTTISVPFSRSTPPSPQMTMPAFINSLQNTPEGLAPVAMPPSSLPANSNFNLPEPFLPSSAPSPSMTSAPSMAETVTASKAPNLIRRISRSARFPRRRGSTNASQRDQSVGPTILRRRSGSRGVKDNMDYSDMDFADVDYCDDSVDDIPEDGIYAGQVTGLGIYNTGRPVERSIPEGSLEPTRDSQLQTGIFLTKVTKGKRKSVKFRLDSGSAKVSWDVYKTTKSFYIDDIQDICVGENARAFREDCSANDIPLEKRWFTISYSVGDKGKSKRIHLVAPDEHIFMLWTKTLDGFSRHRIQLMAGLAGTAEKSANTVWRELMDRKFKNQDHAEDEEKLDLKDVLELCRKLHINCTATVISDHFETADVDRSGHLTQPQYLTFVRRLKERKDIKKLYRDTKAQGQVEMDRPTFLEFLKNTQKIDVSTDLSGWNAVFDRYARVLKTKVQNGEAVPELTMSLQGFSAFLNSPSNAILSPAPSEYSLDRPLNEYFVSSSHNTYLLGRQVAGESSAEAYRTTLQKGCRCIEIDCWDGSDGKPIVVHGRTLTSSCSFSECVKVIANYAFVTSSYPLIISLEVHCSEPQQALMTEDMKREFGAALILQPIDDHEILPSPERLRNKILIKVKAAGEKSMHSDTVPKTTTGRQRSVSSPLHRPTLMDHSPVPYVPLQSSPPSMSPSERASPFWSSPRASATSAGTVPTVPSSDAENSDSQPSFVSDKKSKKKTSKITSVLGELGVYTQGIKFTDFKSLEAKTYNHIFSFAERTFDKLAKPKSDSKALLEAHNMRYLMRVYPWAGRVNSSNFDPLKFWRKGVQMAALNWQTYDLGRQINDAMFASGTDRSGYVLKPEELRYEEHEMTNAEAELKKKPKKQVKFSVNIVSAQQLPRPLSLHPDTSINPYVEFEMFCAEDRKRGIATGEGGLDASARDGMSGIGSPLRKRTRPIRENGYDPIWNENITMTLETKYPSLVFVRWSVWNSPDGTSPASSGGPLATFTAKLSTLQQGYRHLPLYNANGEQYIFSRLFCKIERAEHVAIDELDDGASAETVNVTNNGDGKTSSRRDFFRRVLSRTNSQTKRTKSRPRPEPESTPISRSTTIRTESESYFNWTSTTEKFSN